MMNNNRYTQQHNRGFTLIELIIVIVVLGILSVVAAPRFIDISDDAKREVSNTIMVNFFQAAQLAHLQWQIKDQPDTVTIGTETINMSSAGFPEPTTADADGCINLWQNLLESSAELQAYSAIDTAPAWSVFGFASGCLFFNEDGATIDVSQTPFFTYFSTTGTGDGYNVN